MDEGRAQKKSKRAQGVLPAPPGSPAKRLRLTYERLEALVQLHPGAFAAMLSRTRSGRIAAAMPASGGSRSSTADATCQASPTLLKSPPPRTSTSPAAESSRRCPPEDVRCGVGRVLNLD